MFIASNESARQNGEMDIEQPRVDADRFASAMSR
jgi:hypothetical protein